MPGPSKLAVLLNIDSMVRKGLELLLTDMHMTVISSRSVTELENRISKTNTIPSLLILPLQMDHNLPDSNETGIAYVGRLRERFGKNIPAILLSDQPSPPDVLFSDLDLVVVSDDIKPAKLRDKINQCLAC